MKLIGIGMVEEWLDSQRGDPTALEEWRKRSCYTNCSSSFRQWSEVPQLSSMEEHSHRLSHNTHNIDIIHDYIEELII